MVLPEREWATSTLVRKVMGEFVHLEGRHLFVDIGALTADQMTTLIQFRNRGMHECGLQLVACISELPTKDLVESLKHQGIPLAVNQLGIVANAIPLLLDADPDYGFIDASVIQGVTKDARRRVLLSNLISTAHTLGIEVIAGGVDNPDDFATCRDLNCEMVMGSYIQPAFSSATSAHPNFPHLAQKPDSQNSYNRSIDQRWIMQQLEIIPPLSVETPLKVLFERMAQTSDMAMIPVIERDGRPLGLLLEKTFKNLAYSAYGKDLLSNRGWGKSARDFITRCPIADASTPLDQLLATYSNSEDAPGIIITNDGAYGGFLSTPSIIRALHERTLARAQDENPLTRLPGNALIGEYLNTCLSSTGSFTLAYLDFDNFKPFNDIYGFRQGDRAILLFAQLLRDCETRHGWFIGHIGGDDFFAGIPDTLQAQAQGQVIALIREFSENACSFYDAETRLQGFITGHDRDGNLREFPLLSASAVLVNIPEGRKGFSVDDISATIAHYKKQSKASPNRIAVASLVIPRTSSLASTPELTPPITA